MRRRQKREEGAVTVEAVISLTAFMFAMVTIFTIVNICIVQAKVSCALNATAKEISQYSYLYSIAGLNRLHGKVYENGLAQTEDITSLLSDVNDAYNEIQTLGNSAADISFNNVDSIMTAWDNVSGELQDLQGTGSSIESTLESMASDPKSLLFGIAKIGASKGFDLAKSRLIAAPLARAMCKKNLVNKKDGDVESYLKSLGVVPSASGSYYGGLDFTQSALFPNGSDVIKLVVSYEVHVIELLPVDFTFQFCQSAITHGWPAEELSFERIREPEVNQTIWTQGTVEERASFIRNLLIKDLQGAGYKKTRKLTDVQLYNPEENEFIMIASMNPLWSKEGEPAMTLDDLSDEAIRNNLERLANKMKSTTEPLNEVNVRTEDGSGGSQTEVVACGGAKNKIVLVVPTDEGLKERIDEVLASANTNGVEIEVVASFGRGARTTEVPPAEGEEN